MADQSKWLAREFVTGNGQLYTWHVNTSSATIKSDILLYNPYSTPVTVTFTNIGLTNGNSNDRNAWVDYYNGANNTQTITLQSGQFGSLLHQEGIRPTNLFGKVARFSISGSGVWFYDLAYENNSGSAQSYASKDSSISRTRGLGAGYYENMDVHLTLTDKSATQSFSLGGLSGKGDNKNDSFRGADVIYIKDAAPGTPDPENPYVLNASHNLYGNYGIQMRINLTIDNQCSVGHNGEKVRIFMGSYDPDPYGSALYPFCRFNKQYFTAFTGRVKGQEYIDVLWTEGMPFGETTVTFDFVVLAQSSGPIIIGARWVN